MSNIGAEVGQKMRSAIKAKLLELNCYVDDELPDYVMVMVANKRTKSQMKEDLQLFLSTKTATFVDWLHIVLKKLKEVTVTNPEVYKKTAKRKTDSESTPDANVKKEKKVKAVDKKSDDPSSGETTSTYPSLTDDLPISAANILAEQRKIVIMKETQTNNKRNHPIEDTFDIPLLSEVNMSSERELEDIERKIKNVKSRLGLLVDSESDGNDCIDIKTESGTEDLTGGVNKKLQEAMQSRKIQLLADVTATNDEISLGQGGSGSKRTEHTRITFSDGGGENNEDSQSRRRRSILERLGKRRRSNEINEREAFKKSRIGTPPPPPPVSSSSSSTDKKKSPTTTSRSRDRSEKRTKKDRGKVQKEGVLSRLGVMSKVSIPHKEPEEPEETFKNREVSSVIKIKPRVIPPDAPQANKNLLLKAVAEAQKSVAQTPPVGTKIKVATSQPDGGGLFTKKYKEKSGNDRRLLRENLDNKGRKLLSESEKNKIRKFIGSSLVVPSPRENQNSDNEDSIEYIPKPVKKIASPPKYVPTTKNNTVLEKSDFNNDDDDHENSMNGKIKQHQFIITLDGIEKTKFKEQQITTTKPIVDCEIMEKSVIKLRLDNNMNKNDIINMKKSPSPIIFDRINSPPKLVKSTSTIINIPDKLPLVHAPSSIKNKERCKYWPSCRQGDKCEFVHPTTNCDLFPHCKFRDKCLYLHPSCKFASSCTRRDCPYVHLTPIKARSSVQAVPVLKISGGGGQAAQICKFFPNCTNLSCIFYHPKPCKFGKYCKNQGECNFSHSFALNKSSLTWKSK